MCRRVEEHAKALFPAIGRGDATTAQSHATYVKQRGPIWKDFRSHATCLFCLRRKPEQVLSCKHAICDTCIKIFGVSQLGNEFQLSLTECILCANLGCLTTRLKPSIAGVRILSIDGGGVCGVVPLEFLGLLQDILGADLPLQELFDEAFGTSSGA